RRRGLVCAGDRAPGQRRLKAAEGLGGRPGLGGGGRGGGRGGGGGRGRGRGRRTCSAPRSAPTSACGGPGTASRRSYSSTTSPSSNRWRDDLARGARIPAPGRLAQ